MINKIIDLKPDFLFILGDTFKSINFNRKSKLSYSKYQVYYNINKYNIIDIFKYNLTKLSLNKIEVYILTGNHDYENVDFWSNFSDVLNVQIVISEKDKIITHHYLENDRAFAFWLMPYVPATNAYDRCMAVKNLLTDVNLRFKGKYCFNFLFGHQSVDVDSTIDLKDPDFYRKKEHCIDDYSAPINEELCVDFEASFFGHCHFSRDCSRYHYGYPNYIYFVDQTIKQDCDAKFSLGTIWCCDCNTESDSPKLCIYEVRF